jgi:hypothetical protein
MVKNILVASVQKLILKQGITQDSLKSAHPRVVEGEIAKAYHTMMVQFYSNDINLMNADLDFYAKKYTGTINTDEDGFKYVGLPAIPVDLKNNLGLRYVKPKGGTVNFIRTRENELESLRNLPIYCCMKNAFYYKDGSRIMFDFPVMEHNMVEQVYIKLLPQFEDFEDTDDILFPGGDMPAMQMILQLMGFRPTDSVNDDVK